MSNVERMAQGSAESLKQYVNRSEQLMTEAQDLQAVACAEQLCLKVVRGLPPTHRNAVDPPSLPPSPQQLLEGETDAVMSLERHLRQSLHRYPPIAKYSTNHQPQPLLKRMRAQGWHFKLKEKLEETLTFAIIVKKWDTYDIRRVCPKYLAGEPPAPRPQRQHLPRQILPHQLTPHATQPHTQQTQMPRLGAGGRHYQASEGMTDAQLIESIVRRLRSSSNDLPATSNAPGSGQARVFTVTTTASCNSSTGICRERHFLWFDWGSTHDVVNRKEMLFECKASPVCSVQVAGGEVHKVECCGVLKLQGPEGSQVMLPDVLCVPSFHVNLVSETQLMTHGVSIYKADGQATMRDVDGYVFMKGHMESQLCRLDHKLVLPPNAGRGRSVAVALSWDVYHQILGHPSMDATKMLLRSNAIHGADEGNVPPDRSAFHCQACIKAKQTRASFELSTSTASSPVHLLHSDIMGPFKLASMGRKTYVATLHNDYSKHGEVSA
jgi:hypothetical protein